MVIWQLFGGKATHDTWLDKQKILKFCLLLKKDLVNAINKGNYSLFDLAKTMIKFFRGVLSPSLLEEGLKGNEETFYNIQWFSHNEGWWAKANKINIGAIRVVYTSGKENNLKSNEDAAIHFILANAKWVHLNVIKIGVITKAYG